MRYIHVPSNHLLGTFGLELLYLYIQYTYIISICTYWIYISSSGRFLALNGPGLSENPSNNLGNEAPRTNTFSCIFHPQFPWLDYVWLGILLVFSVRGEGCGTRRWLGNAKWLPPTSAPTNSYAVHECASVSLPRIHTGSCLLTE